MQPNSSNNELTGYPSDEFLAYTPEVAVKTQSIFDRLHSVLPDIEWAVHAPYVAAINELKSKLNAVILAHNYQTPEIFHGVADITGDSLALAQQAARTDADVIVLCGVHFMAETAKLLSPEKTVLIPDSQAGCSLASSITPNDVRVLRQRYPGVPVVTYVNTSAGVKAESDICCTSANAVEVVESLGEVHERFTAEDVRHYKQQFQNIEVLAHPECPPDVLAEVDFVGSTAGMIKHLNDSSSRRVVMITECSMSDNVAVEFPKIEFIRPCNLCPHMKRITLPKILRSLQTMEHKIEIDPSIAEKARRAVERMVAIGRRD